jgi:hypothetical protein
MTASQITTVRKAELLDYRKGAQVTLPTLRFDQKAQHILRMRYSLASDAANRAS